MKFLMLIDIENRLPYLSSEVISQVILENNAEFTAISPYNPAPIRSTKIMVECENKPRDMPVFGISWKEIL